MTPIKKVDIVSDEEIPFRTSSAESKVIPFDFETSSSGSHADVANSWIFKRIQLSPLRTIYIVLLKGKINMLLPFGPIAIVVHHFSRNRGLVFILSLLGITPLAERLGYATEQLAFYTGSTVGGLLNATFGNATEMIISIYALKSGMTRVVQQSLLGSILSNMLLVLGLSFFAGGIAHNRVQKFHKAAALVNAGLLLMAVMGITFPAVLHFTHTEIQFGNLSKRSTMVWRDNDIQIFSWMSGVIVQNSSSPKIPMSTSENGNHEEDSSDVDAPELTFWEAIFWLAMATLWISVLSGYVVHTIEGASESLNMPLAFISVVLLPIVGNAAEHASAIIFATKDKLDITIGIAIGSCTQISMFLIPFCVVAGWIMRQPMDLNFQLFETATLFITVIVVTFMLQDGKANYFKGLMLVLCYLIVAASFFVHVGPSNDDA